MMTCGSFTATGPLGPTAGEKSCGGPPPSPPDRRPPPRVPDIDRVHPAVNSDMQVHQHLAFVAGLAFGLGIESPEPVPPGTP